jgi:hypothetical protein
MERHMKKICALITMIVLATASLSAQSAPKQLTADT